MLKGQGLKSQTERLITTPAGPQHFAPSGDEGRIRLVQKIKEGHTFTSPIHSDTPPPSNSAVPKKIE